MLLAPILCMLPLAAPQERLAPETGAPSQVELPAIGSAQAKAAQEAWRVWLDELPASPRLPMHAVYDFQLAFEATGDGTDERFKLTAKGSLSSDYRSGREMRHHLRLSGTLVVPDEVPEQGPFDLQADLLLDGKTLWFMVKSEDQDLIPDGGFLARADQATLEELYRLYLQSLPALADMVEAEEPGTRNMLQGLSSSMPKEFGDCLHPLAYLRSYRTALTCRRFRVIGDTVEADLSLDLSPESPIGQMMDYVGSVATPLGPEADEVDQVIAKVRQSLADMSYHMVFLADDGFPTTASFRFAMDSQDWGLPTDENFSFIMSFDSTARATFPESLDASLFAAPKSSDQAFDVTMFLQMAQSQLRALVEQAESGDGDLAF